MKYCIVWFKCRHMYTLKYRSGDVKQYQEITLKMNPEIAGQLMTKDDIDSAVDGVKYYMSYELFEEIS